MPYTPSTASSVINNHFGLAYVNRMNVFNSAVADLLNKMTAQGTTEDQFVYNLAFIPSITYGLDLCRSSYNEYKFRFLSKALCNSVLGPFSLGVIQLHWQNFTNLSSLHLQLLLLFNDVEAGLTSLNRTILNPESYSAILEAAYPELSGQGIYYNQAWNDLFLRKFVTVENLAGIGENSVTTDYGKAFVDFISSE